MDFRTSLELVSSNFSCSTLNYLKTAECFTIQRTTQWIEKQDSIWPFSLTSWTSKRQSHLFVYWLQFRIFEKRTRHIFDNLTDCLLIICCMCLLNGSGCWFCHSDLLGMNQVRYFFSNPHGASDMIRTCVNFLGRKAHNFSVTDAFKNLRLLSNSQWKLRFSPI